MVENNLPSKYSIHYKTNETYRSNANYFRLDRNVSDIGFISEYKQNEIVSSTLIETENLTKITEICALLNKEILIGVIVYFEENQLHAIEVHTYSEEWPADTQCIQVMSKSDFDEIMTCDSRLGKLLKSKYG